MSLGSGANTLADLIIFILGVLAFCVEVFALQDAIRQRTDAYPAAGKMTKTIWLSILGVATAVGLVSLIQISALGLISLIAFVAAGVYLADVRPALRQISGGGGNSGPYGRW